MNARYVMLIQKQFDEPLSERETYELQGFLAGNEAAAKLRENLQRILEESEKLELPEHLKPQNAETLVAQILTAIAKTESKSWFTLVKNFVRGREKKAQIGLSHQDELAVLRKHKISNQNRNSNDNDTIANNLRSKVMDEVAPVVSHDAVSLAVAIKRRMLETSGDSPLEQHASQLHPESQPRATTPPEPLTQSLSNSMDQVFNSSNWPVLDPETIQSTQTQAEFVAPPGPEPFNSLLKKRSFQQQQEQQRANEHREPKAPAARELWSEPVPEEQMEPIWQLELEAQIPLDSIPPSPTPLQSLEPIPQRPSPLESLEPIAQRPSPLESLEPIPQSPQQAQILRPAGLIPVDDIIAHVSLMFSEPTRNYAPNTVPHQEADTASKIEQAPTLPPIHAKLPIPSTEDPLGLASGAYPQINQIDLQKATSARLAKVTPDDESQGQIKGLINFLLDQQSAAAINNLATSSANLSNARILSNAEAQALQECLSPIERLQGVAGCIILGYDGMIIMSSLPDHADKDALSAWALLTYMNSHDLIRVIGHTRLRQFVSRTVSGYLLLADFGQGLLLTVSDNASTEAILPLMKSVRKVTAA
jgi:predicted regulator of Ras-like GTPase activity (Roadblock/LC7/MglB family)